jgi:hypothetical protein
MPDRVFREDFFERVVDVKWQEEKKCYFMAGDSQGATYSYGSHYYTSDDGMHWDTHQGGNGRAGNLYGFTSGMWMRTNFDPEGAPLWILGGEGVTADYSSRMSGLQISFDGLSLGEPRWFDNHSYPGHFVGQFFADNVDGQGGGTARLESTSFSHADTFTSKDGISWSPDHYHSTASLRTARIDPKIRPPELLLPDLKRIIPAYEIPDDYEVTTSHAIEMAATPHPDSAIPYLARAAGITPFAAAKIIKQNDLYQLSNRTAATGTLRKGKYAGKVVTIRGGKSHGFHGPGTPASDYFESSCSLVDAKTGKTLGKADNGVHFGHSMAYGYYVFVCGGGDQAGNSLLSHTEDGLHWHTQMVGSPSHSIWSLCVGPRSDIPRRKPVEPDDNPPPIPGGSTRSSS